MIKEELNPWQVLSANEVYDNNWISLTHHEVINPGGGKGIYGKVHFKNVAIGILALDDELNTWLVGQFRFVLNKYSWEIPEGGGPHGIDPLESAKRELLEETGLTASSWQEIQRMDLSNSVTDEYAIIYLARDLQQGLAEPEETEELQVRKLPFEEVYNMVTSGQITDSITVAAILKAKILLIENKI
jgi:ADP-ribose pyrophosphatase